jgi:hypothetical protein
MVTSIISRAAFGVKSNDQDEFVNLVKKVVELAAGFDVDDLFPSIKLLHKLTGMKPKLEKIHKRVDEIIENIVRQHQEKLAKRKENNNSEVENEDLVDVLLRIQETNNLDIQITTKISKL